MENFFYADNNQTKSKDRKKLIEKGLIRKLAPRLYTSILSNTKLDLVLRTEWTEVIQKLFPEVVLSHRSAFEFKPDTNNCLYFSSNKSRTIKLASISFVFIKSAPHHETDIKFMGIHCSSKMRAMLEMFGVSPTSDSRFLSQSEIEKKLENILIYEGESSLNQLRDDARKYSESLNMQSNFKRLDQKIGSLLGTKKVKSQSDSFVAASKGNSYDTSRAILFSELSSFLKNNPVAQVKDQFYSSHDHFLNKAFFESYFSNYVEGTKFLIEEAEQIVFEKVIIPNRIKDSHDVLGTFNICSNQNFLNNTPSTFDEFILSLKFVNREILNEREELAPGEFKSVDNQAGNSIFVKHNQVIGTLLKGYDYYQDLKDPFSKALFLSFMISEVHPFNDGNGRTCRIFLNSELYKAGLPTIIIPTVYREDYLTGLKTITKKGICGAYVRMFTRAFNFSHMDFTDYQKIKKSLISKNWFLEPSDGKIIE